MLDLPPSYDDLLSAPTLAKCGGWYVGKGKSFAWVLPVGGRDVQVGWRLCVTVAPSFLACAWNVLREIMARRVLGGRVAVSPKILEEQRDFEGDGLTNAILLMLSVDGLSSGEEALALAYSIEKRLKDAGCLPGRPLFSCRPLSGSLYLSVRCDPPEIAPAERRIDYNFLSRPGLFWNVQLENRIDVPGDDLCFLKSVAGPDIIWEEAAEGWLARGPLRTLRAVRRALLGHGISAKLGLAAGNYAVWLPLSAAKRVRYNWFACRESVDVWRVVLLLGRFPVREVRKRESDSVPPRVVMGDLSSEEESRLMGYISSGGLVAWRIRGGPLEILVPGRLAADMFEAAVDDEGENIVSDRSGVEDELEALPAQIEEAQSLLGIELGQKGRKQIYPKGMSGLEIQRQLKQAKEGVVNSVTNHTGPDHAFQNEEDPRRLLADIGIVLDAVSRLGENKVARIKLAESRGVSLAIKEMVSRPDLSMARAFVALKRAEGVVVGAARHLAEKEEIQNMASQIENLAKRIRARINAGPPQMYLPPTPEARELFSRREE